MKKRFAASGLAIALTWLAMAVMPAQLVYAATFTVPCSVPALVVAINTANSTAGADTLNLAGGCIYTLVSPDNAANGLPVITTDIIINGNGTTITRDPSASAFRILEVTHGGNLTLNRSTLSRGVAADCPDFPGIGICGGGIANRGTLNVNNSRIINNTASGDPPAAPDFTFVEGGGIDTAGTATITNSDVSGNSVSTGADSGIASSGGIENDGTLTVQNSRVTNNTVIAVGNAQESAAGGIGDFAPLTVTGSLLANNTVTCSSASTCLAVGGGIVINGAFFGPFDVDVTGTRIVKNTVSCTGVCSSTLAGGIYLNETKLTLERSEVANNTVSCNSYSCGTARAGAIYNRNTVLTMTSSRIASNTVSCSASASDCIARAGGIYVRSAGSPSSATLTGSTVTGNRVTGPTAEGGGIFFESGAVTLDRSKITANSPDNCAPPGTVPGCTG
jgi:hypothetical protein